MYKNTKAVINTRLITLTKQIEQVESDVDYHKSMASIKQHTLYDLRTERDELQELLN